MKTFSLIFVATASLVGLINLSNGKLSSSSSSVSSDSLLERLERVESELTTAKKKIPPPGTIVAFAGKSVPDGWIRCDGRPLNRNEAKYKPLFDAISTTFGNGDRSRPGTNFNIPDLKGRVVVGVGQGARLSNRKLAKKFGSETHKLTVAQMPGHTHAISSDRGGNENLATLPAPAHTTNRDERRDGTRTTSTGGSQAHPIVQPSLGLEYLIKL